MCKLSTTSSRKKIRGYKIVARKPNGKRYFSIAMGFKYPLDGHIPVVRKQHKICFDFASDIILKNSFAHTENMVGRTALFLDLEILHTSKQILRWTNTVKEEYKLIIIQAEISTDIMTGFYGNEDCLVAAGRHIRFIKEIQELN